MEIADGETALAIKLKAPPVDGKANQALIAFMAKTLGVPKNAIVLIRGQKNRVKVLEIDGVSPAEIEKLGGKSP